MTEPRYLSQWVARADWRIGDLALCIKQGAWRSRGEVNQYPPIRGGGVYRVADVATADGLTALWFDEYPGPGLEYAFAHFCFIKITPPEADAFDREVIGLMAGQTTPAEA